MKPAAKLFENPFLGIMLGIIGICILLNYVFLRNIYQPHNTDNTWTLALIHDYMADGITDDPIVRRGPSSWNAEGLKFFRRTHALIYGQILSITGWNYRNAQTISAILVLLAGALWVPILRKLNFSRNFSLVYIALFFFLEFSLTAATNLREEAFLLTLQSLGFLLVIERRYVWAGLVSAVALETHPIGLMNLALPICWIFAEQAQNRSHENHRFVPIFAKLLAGLGLGGIYYWFVYKNNALDIFRYALSHTGKIDPNAKWGYGALGQYFFATKYFRHLPELFLLFFSLYIFMNKKIYKERLFIIIALPALIVLSSIRDNFFYAILIYPVFLLVIVSAFEYIRKLGALLALCFLLMAPQYSFVYYLNHRWDRETYLKEIMDMVPRDNLPVLGSAPAWFALMDKNFKDAISSPEIFSRLDFREFYLLEDRFTRDEKVYANLLRHIRSHYDETPVGTADMHGNHLVLKRMVALEVARESSGRK